MNLLNEKLIRVEAPIPNRFENSGIDQTDQTEFHKLTGTFRSQKHHVDVAGLSQIGALLCIFA
ncbi:MAG: hypothetical protein A2W25_01270 [candidate division Zixibacteria bacterium RBG_16_53_22]|nr:MAG: hypothetical protein A2W25_01270 [candidate division Zixibacteria bacterium RBG_16_53_22]